MTSKQRRKLKSAWLKPSKQGGLPQAILKAALGGPLRSYDNPFLAPAGLLVARVVGRVTQGGLLCYAQFLSSLFPGGEDA